MSVSHHDMSDNDAATMSLPAVAREIGISVRTLQRREAELVAVGAEKQRGGWKIPVSKVDDLKAMIDATPATVAPSVSRHDATTDATDGVARVSRDELERTQRKLEDAQREHDKLTLEFERLRADLAVAKAIASEREDTIRDLRAERDKLIDAQAKAAEAQTQATASNAALALSLRESMQMIEQRAGESVPPTTPASDTGSDSPSTAGETSRPTTERRGRFGRIFDRL